MSRPPLGPRFSCSLSSAEQPAVPARQQQARLGPDISLSPLKQPLAGVLRGTQHGYRSRPCRQTANLVRPLETAAQAGTTRQHGPAGRPRVGGLGAAPGSEPPLVCLGRRSCSQSISKESEGQHGQGALPLPFAISKPGPHPCPCPK